MILRRIGNKSRIANKIVSYFPKHEIYCEMFFGAGGLFFNKPKAKYNICNDIDSEVFNLYNVTKNNPDSLYEAVYKMPIHDDLWNYWKVNKEKDTILQAVRFLFLSNFGYMGKPDALHFGVDNSKEILLQNIYSTNKLLFNVKFMNTDFRNVINKISFKVNDKQNTFIYADPPYLNTCNNYSDRFTKKDTEDLFEILVKSGIRFAISEFDTPIILELAKQYKLNINTISERVNLKNRRTEILITNYENYPTLFDLY